MPTSHRKTILPQLKERRGCSPRPLTQKRKEHRKQPLVCCALGGTRLPVKPPPASPGMCAAPPVIESFCRSHSGPGAQKGPSFAKSTSFLRGGAGSVPRPRTETAS